MTDAEKEREELAALLDAARLELAEVTEENQRLRIRNIALQAANALAAEKLADLERK